MSQTVTQIELNDKSNLVSTETVAAITAKINVGNLTISLDIIQGRSKMTTGVEVILVNCINIYHAITYE